MEEDDAIPQLAQSAVDQEYPTHASRGTRSPTVTPETARTRSRAGWAAATTSVARGNSPMGCQMRDASVPKRLARSHLFPRTKYKQRISNTTIGIFVSGPEAV